MMRYTKQTDIVEEFDTRPLNVEAHNIEQLIKLIKSGRLDAVVAFGKHRGKIIEAIPQDYIDYCTDVYEGTSVDNVIEEKK